MKLQNKKFYVGKTDNPDVRLTQHFTKGGSAWTKKYKPVNVEKIIPNCDDYDEDKITQQYMDKYGIDNVRGGSFTRIKLDEATINILPSIKKKIPLILEKHFIF